MSFYLVVGVVSLVLVPIALRRSGSMTKYVMYTGAPIVWVLLAIASLSAAAVEYAGDPSTAQGVFTGGLIGTAFVLVVLMRRGVSGHDQE